jgi:predicted enzyme related to lactoylglutathione lyase
MQQQVPDHFSFTKLLVNDLEQSAQFYRSVCGLTELARVKAQIAGRGIEEIMFNATGEGAATFVLLKFIDGDRVHTDEVIIGFATPDLEAFVERVIVAGGGLVEPIRVMPEHGVKVAFVQDIEGHLIEVVEML